MPTRGKEATVYLCRANATVDADHLAAKVYRTRRFRAFATESRYIDTRHMRDRRMAKAIRKGTRKGKRQSHFLWHEREWRALCLL